jgi:vanillate O-demethylase monooxygenase subunit
MGNAEEADTQRICPVNHWDDASWGRNDGDVLNLDCNYLFVTDNLLDPSHVAWVHRSSFGNVDAPDGAVNVTVTDTGVTASRWMNDVEVAPFYVPFIRFSGRCDRLQQYEVRFPSHAIIRALFVPAGTGGSGAPLDERAFVMDSYNFMTPVDAHRTRYFWFQMRNFAPGDTAISAQMTSAVRAAFEEDRIVLNAVAAGFAASRTPNIDLAIDSGPLRFRRKLEQLIAAESATAS